VSEKDCRKYAFQVLGTIEGLNEHGIVHRDIKPANLLLTWEGDAETADLNACAYNEGEGRMHTIDGGFMVGTEGFRAPEVEDPDYDSGITYKCDISSLGRTLVVLALGYNALLWTPKDVALGPEEGRVVD